MLLVLGHTNWPDTLSLLVSSRSSLLDRNPSADFMLRPAEPAKESAGLRVPPKHQRASSGPFDVLYDGQLAARVKTPALPPTMEREYRSPSYIEIEQTILAGSSFANHLSSPHAPTVTVIDESKLRRTGSVISERASLRRRKHVKARVLAQRAAEAPLDPDSPKRKQRFSFAFPIRRRRSFKYSAAPTHSARARFHSQQEIDEYFLLNNITSLMKDILPRTMATYKFENLAAASPKLVTFPTHFAISRDARFTQLSRRADQRPELSVTFQGVRLESADHSKRDTHTLSSSRAARASLLAKRTKFLASVYSKYRESTLASRAAVPAKINEVLPFESELMSQEEQEKLNTQILLEILLRRTVAAKIEFRLRRSTSTASKSGTYLDPSNPSSRSSFSFAGAQNKHEKHLHHRRSAPKKRGSSNDEISSLDTDKIMKHNTSLLSELLPSPQVSFASNLFDFPHRERMAEATLHHSWLPPKGARTSSSNYSEKSSPVKLGDIKGVFEYEHQSAYFRSGSNSQESYFNRKGSKKLSSSDQKNLFIYDFNKINLPSRAKSDPANAERSLGNVSLSLLKPLNRSHETISSLASHEGQSNVSSGSGSKRNSDRRQTALSTSTAQSKEPIRNSRSTTNTSLLQSLDELSKEANDLIDSSQYLKQKRNPKGLEILSPTFRELDWSQSFSSQTPETLTFAEYKNRTESQTPLS